MERFGDHFKSIILTLCSFESTPNTQNNVACYVVNFDNLDCLLLTVVHLFLRH